MLSHKRIDISGKLQVLRDIAKYPEWTVTFSYKYGILGPDRLLISTPE